MTVPARREAVTRLRQHAGVSERRALGLVGLHILLAREGVQMNWKRVYRVYREEGLTVRRRRRKRIAVPRQPMAIPQVPNERWSMDFVHDMLHDGRRIRMLNVVDDCTRECLAIETDTSLPGTRVIEVLERLRDQRGLPRAIVARQRTRVRRACAGSVGARARAQDRLHPAG